ncbi:glycosyltransferase family 4 protein [Novipirellula herctigrandis]
MTPSVRRPTLLSVGRLVQEKGHELVIQALPGLVRQHPDLCYVVLGEGPYRGHLLELARSLDVAQHVQLSGWIDHDQAIRQMVLADVVIMPSRSVQEGFGLALAEAMLCGTPIVASRIPVFEEVADDDSNALRFFTDGDSSSLGQTISDVLASDPNEANFDLLSQRVREKFDVQRMSQAYADLYAEVLADSQTRGR